MRNIIILALVIISLSLFGCSQNPGVESGGENSPEDNIETNQSKDNVDTEPSVDNNETDPSEGEDKSIIKLQGFSVIVPQGCTGTGGHDGVKFINATITPIDPNLTYEIEVGYGIAGTSSDFESLMFVRGHYNDVAVKALVTDEWKTKCEAYTFIRTNDDSGAFTNFKKEYGASQIIGFYRENQWLEAELRVKPGSLSDYPHVLEEFMSTYIDWEN